jgi:preprotein translocase subunit SecA
VRLDGYDENGVAPLHGAVANNRHAICDFLLTHGCDVMQPVANAEKTTAFTLAKNSTMTKLLQSYLGKQEIPEFPPPIPYAVTEEGAVRLGNAPPAEAGKEGLTVQERAVISKFPGQRSSEYYAMALKFKKEFGLGKFYFLFGNSLHAPTMKTLRQLLTLNEANKGMTGFERTYLNGLFCTVWRSLRLPQKEIEQLLQAPYEAVIAQKSDSRSPKEMADAFHTQVKAPLSPESTQRLSEKYASVLRHLENLSGKEQAELAQIAKTSQDPAEAIAAIRETVFRIFGYYPYDTQLFAVLALIDHPKGRLGQMQTGEGKSLVLAMMAAWYAARGKVVDVITTTQTLAKRDQKKFGEFYQALQISSSHVAIEHPEESDFVPSVIYGTNTDFEFALLRRQLKRAPQVALIDEVDSLFLDEGLNAARIAQKDSQNYSWLYTPYLNWIKTHSRFDAAAVRTLLGSVNREDTLTLSDDKLEALFHRGKTALAQREKVDYVVQGGKIVIVDYENTGDPHKGCRWDGGLHEFLEAKHNLTIEPNSLTVASISHVAFFKRYETLVGLSGTLGGPEERAELGELYGTELFDIPPRFPSERVYLSWRLCDDMSSYYAAIQKRVREMQSAGRPVLILLQTIEDSEKMVEALTSSQISCQLYNAVQQEKDEILVKKAAAPGTVTVATSTAGRGTDIVLFLKSIQAGGLHVIVGFLPYNQRVENQGTGRAKRQGQPGSYEVIIPPNTPFVEQLMLLRGGKERLPEAMKDKRIWLLRLRALRVKNLSEMRKKQSESSLIHYSLFQDFSQKQRIVEERLSGLPLADCREKLTHLWAEFSLETEHQLLSREQFHRKYERFLESRVFPLPWFEGLHFSRQDLAVVEEGKR